MLLFFVFVAITELNFAKMWENLPKDIWLDICLRIPIKTLVICACTCKTLLNFITSPEFMASHNKKSKDNPFILLRYYLEGDGKSKEYFSLHPDNGVSESNLLFQQMPVELDRASCFSTLWVLVMVLFVCLMMLIHTLI